MLHVSNTLIVSHGEITNIIEATFHKGWDIQISRPVRTSNSTYEDVVSLEQPVL
jgi:hypothetical protein